MSFPFFRQYDSMDCGPACLRMIASFYGKEFSMDYLREESHITREGVSLMALSEAAEKVGFRTMAVECGMEELLSAAPLPCILFWNQNHFIVLPPQKFKKGKLLDKVLLADPRHGLVNVDIDTFRDCWVLPSTNEGVALFLELSDLYEHDEDQPVTYKKGFSYLMNYIKPFRKHIIFLFLGLALSSLLSLIFPFLTQGLVDYGINGQNIKFVYLILFSQLLLFAGSSAIDIFRSWTLIHVNSRININLVTDFLAKLMRLPIRFFDTTMIGDLHQRMADHQRVQQFLTGSTLSVLFSVVNLFIFSIVLAVYSWTILGLFIFFSAAAVGWILLFLKKRKELDYKHFQRMSEQENVLLELINGMQEIKLNNCEIAKRWEWEKLQSRLFHVNVKSLSIGQYQQLGSLVFHQLKNILISFVSATEVMNGNMTLGMMLSVSYIIGQMNGPLDHMLTFIHEAQDARLSLDRLGEIQLKQDEEEGGYLSEWKNEGGLGDIYLKNVSFQYGGPSSAFVLKGIDLKIPKGKITAIVGSSGSGKTTLLKMLLKFYDPVEGSIEIGKTDFRRISPSMWRKQCGTVLQEGYLFSDSIAGNICISDEYPDQMQLEYAVKIANIKDFIKEQPLGYQTKIGNSGNVISTGQKQRLLIARAVYKDPEYLFLDEATSALDANNERTIIENLKEFFRNRTVVVIAHRLSTVKHADQIVVLENGEIKEIGTHEELSALRGSYYTLVKNQLELGT